MIIYTGIVMALMIFGGGMAVAEKESPTPLLELLLLMPIFGRILGWW